MKQNRICICFLSLVASLCAAHLVVAEDADFGGLERWENVVWVDHPSNDGDSFYVRYDDEQHLLRLYYVDTPETSTASETDARRVRDQTRYFGLLHHRDTVHFGAAAADFTRDQLSRPFTVYTARATAPGRSVSPRIYTFVETADGEDLASLLVTKGLARAFGVRRALPDGRTAADGASWFSDLESAAMLERTGIWASSDADRLIAARAESRKELAELRAIHTSVRFPAEPIDINVADLRALEMLPGIGPVTARNILESRPFDGPDDLLRVPRITERTIEDLLPHLKWGDDSD